MPFVLDTSVTLAWLFPDEDEKALDEIADRLVTDTAYAPAIWPLEVTNALLTASRRGRIADKDIDEIIEQVARLPVTVETTDPHTVFTEIPGLARAHNLTSYDAAYFELAIRRQLPVATLDRRLRECCDAAGITVLP